jgi:hypothetical protein
MGVSRVEGCDAMQKADEVEETSRQGEANERGTKEEWKDGPATRERASANERIRG